MNNILFKILMLKGDAGEPTDEQTMSAVSEWLSESGSTLVVPWMDTNGAGAVGEWLDDHPEATTSVLDGSLTEPKFSAALKLKAIKDYVTPQMFGAVGDGVSDDTQAFVDAIDAVQNGGVVYVPDGHYLISQITIPKNVTLMANHPIIPYSVTKWYDQDNAHVDDIPCLLKKNTDDENMIICYGFLENICVDGNNKSGNAVLMLGGFYGLFVTRAEKAVRLYTDGYGDGTVISNSNNYDLENLFLMGNLGDALTITGADARIQHFNIASNKGHGVVITQTGGTLYFNEGKIEWNGKNNLYTTAYCREIVFNNCILDSANWYNFYDEAGGDFVFDNCMFKGGRRDDPLYNIPISDKTVLSQIYIEYSTTSLIFNGCYFRKDNGGGAIEQIEYILGCDTSLSPLTFVVFSACNMPTFAIDKIRHNVPKESVSIVGSNFYQMPLIGAPAQGIMPVLPFTDTLNSTSQRYPIDGAMGYDYQKNFALLNVYGNIRKIATFADYTMPTTIVVSATGTGVVDPITLPTDKGCYLIACGMGGSGNTNYYYIGVFVRIYGTGILVDIAKSSGVTAAISDGKITISNTQTIYDGRLSIVQL